MKSTDTMQRMNCRGWARFDNLITETDVEQLRIDLASAYLRCRNQQVSNQLSADTTGTSHHVLGQGDSLDGFLENGYLVPEISALLDGPIILNSYGGFSNAPQTHSYVTRVHRDVRTFTPNFRLMVNMLVMLDDFTVDNGATHVLSGSHNIEEKPTDAFFFQNSDRILGKAGDIVLFDSRLWHSAGENRTHQPRRALTLTFTRPFVKQQFDYPRYLTTLGREPSRPELRQLIGYNSRVPSNLDEWYQPPERRWYRTDQG